MGQCGCKCKEKRRRSSTNDDEENRREEYRPSGRRQTPWVNRPPGADPGYGDERDGSGRSRSSCTHNQRLANIGFDIRDLILETLTVIRTLVNNEQEPPPSMLKLNIIADKEQGWLLIIQTMIDIVPSDNPLGPAVITLFLDESPLPTKDTVSKLLFYLNLDEQLSRSSEYSPTWHRNVCIVLGCIAEKLAGPNSVATFKPQTLGYLVANLNTGREAYVILFSMIALEKYAQTSENKQTISEKLREMNPNPLEVLEGWIASPEHLKRQVGFCAQWALDNLFVKKGRPFSYQTVNTKGINAMLNHEDVSEYLKISPNGLEARCDVSSFESVRCTFQVMEGVWYYEALIVTPGVMQIGWATKDSKFLNHEGYGIGDDEYSVAYDGCRQLIWHNASSQSHSHQAWKPGDILGCLLDVDQRFAQFYLNGEPLKFPHTQVFNSARSGFFAAASFMSFQQCQFNFGYTPFKFAPLKRSEFMVFNDFAALSDEQRIILPRHRKLELLRQLSVPENSCQLCYSNEATVTLKPCNHSGFCSTCSLVVELCPMCRGAIEQRYDSNDPHITDGSTGQAVSVVEVEEHEDPGSTTNYVARTTMTPLNVPSDV